MECDTFTEEKIKDTKLMPTTHHTATFRTIFWLSDFKEAGKLGVSSVRCACTSMYVIAILTDLQHESCREIEFLIFNFSYLKNCYLVNTSTTIHF